VTSFTLRGTLTHEVTNLGETQVSNSHVDVFVNTQGMAEIQLSGFVNKGTEKLL